LVGGWGAEGGSFQNRISSMCDSMEGVKVTTLLRMLAA